MFHTAEPSDSRRGAAAGVAGTFNAPVAGAHSPKVVASTVITRYFQGNIHRITIGAGNAAPSADVVCSAGFQTRREQVIHGAFPTAYALNKQGTLAAFVGNIGGYREVSAPAYPAIQAVLKTGVTY